MKDEKTKKNSPKRLIYAAIAIIILIPAIFYLQSYFNGQGNPKAAIIDQLGSSKLDNSVRYENQTFVETTNELLNERFFVVDFYSDNATVEQYRQLASAGYKLIVWRAHSALDLNSTYVAISTTERYVSTDQEQEAGLMNGQLTLCSITGDQTLYVGITPKFIEEVMAGSFQDTVIVLMSCNGLLPGYLKTAQAFEAKGAKAVISWDGWVSSPDNDHGASLLLQRLIGENETISAAVNNTSFFSTEFGWANLRYYPSGIGSYQIPDYRQHDDPQRDALMTFAFFRKTEEEPDALEATF